MFLNFYSNVFDVIVSEVELEWTKSGAYMELLIEFGVELAFKKTPAGAE